MDDDLIRAVEREIDALTILVCNGLLEAATITVAPERRADVRRDLSARLSTACQRDFGVAELAGSLVLRAAQRNFDQAENPPTNPRAPARLRLVPAEDHDE